jgi:hypothetical protein
VNSFSHFGQQLPPRETRVSCTVPVHCARSSSRGPSCGLQAESSAAALTGLLLPPRRGISGEGHPQRNRLSLRLVSRLTLPNLPLNGVAGSRYTCDGCPVPIKQHSSPGLQSRASSWSCVTADDVVRQRALQNPDFVAQMHTHNRVKADGGSSSNKESWRCGQCPHITRCWPPTRRVFGLAAVNAFATGLHRLVT